MFPVSERSLEKLLLLKGRYHYNSRDGFSVIIYKDSNVITVEMKVPQFDNFRYHYLISNHGHFVCIPSAISHINYYWRYYDHYLKVQAMCD